MHVTWCDHGRLACCPIRRGASFGSLSPVVISFEFQASDFLASENLLKVSVSDFGCMSVGVTMVGLSAALFVGVLP